jgi:hypothetical protein
MNPDDDDMDERIRDALSERPLTTRDEDALGQVRHFLSARQFAEPLRPRLAMELLVAGVLAAAALTVVIALERPTAHTPTPAGPTQPLATASTGPSAPPSATATPAVVSTVTARPPLVLYYAPPSSGDVIQLYARTYAGKLAGTLVIPYFDMGYDVAPDGSKVLDGNEIISVNGSTIGHITWPYPTLPVWADDSAHLCGLTYQPGGQTKLVIFDKSGVSRTVAAIGPSTVSTAWTVIACSPGADRAVVAGGGATDESIVTVRLSTGARVSTHTFASNASWGLPIASHDGRIIAVNEASGISIRDGATWALRARVVRWGSQAGYPLIGAAVLISWDGSRILVDGGGASGAEHPMWLVDWATDRNVLSTVSSPAIFAGTVGAIVPLTEGSSFLIPSGDGNTYLLHDDGKLAQVS